jgi:hypothetical protein
MIGLLRTESISAAMAAPKNRMKIPCSHCSGKGKIELQAPLRDCLDAMRKIGPATREQIHSATKANGNRLTSTYQRVRRLVKYKLAKEVGSERPQRFEASRDK